MHVLFAPILFHDEGYIQVVNALPEKYSIAKNTLFFYFYQTGGVCDTSYNPLVRTLSSAEHSGLN